MEEQSGRSWKQQPYVWMIIFIPAVSVVGGFLLLYFAISSFDGMVVDDYYQQGKEINRVLERDHKARALGLSASLNLDREKKRVSMVLYSGNAAYAYPDRLRLRFLYRTRAGFDQEIALIHQSSNRYQGILPALRVGKWDVLLEHPQWRLWGFLATADHLQTLSLQPVN